MKLSSHGPGGSRKSAPLDYLSPLTASKFSGLLNVTASEGSVTVKIGSDARSWDEKSVKGIAFFKV